MDRILVIEDSADVRRMLRLGLGGHGWEVDTAPDGKTARDRLERGGYAVVVSDIRLPDVKDLELISFIKSAAPEAKLVVMTAHATVALAKECVRKGAATFIVKPFTLEQMRYTVETALMERRILAEDEDSYGRELKESRFCDLVGKSPAMCKVYRAILTVAKTDSPVIIYGETGTGKELAARAIHQSSDRSSKSLVAVNCASLSESLLESELFGHVKGAFTGAIRDKNGLLREARDSTVLLDEISELSGALQARLLRFLQNGEVRPVGSSTVQISNARVVATTNVPLEERVAQGKFREDLFHRLNVICLVLPPLRERKEDIPLLSHSFLAEFVRAQKKPIRSITPEALSLLMARDWPGNIRELRNAIERAVTFCAGDAILPGHLQSGLPSGAGAESEGALLDLGKTIEATERTQIEKALQATGGNKSKAAEMLGIDRITLWRKIKAYRLSERA